MWQPTLGSINIDSTFIAGSSTTESFTVQNGASSYNVNVSSAQGASSASAIAAINSQLAGSGVTAVLGQNGTDINFQSSNSFSVNETALGTGGGLFTALGAQAVTAPTVSATNIGNAASGSACN